MQNQTEHHSLQSQATQLADSARSKATDLYQQSQSYVRANPALFVVGSFALGVAIGAACGSREWRKQDNLAVARGLAEDLAARIGARMPRLDSAVPGELFEQAQSIGKKLKWW